MAEELNLTIRRDEACLDFAGTDVILYPCHGDKGNQYWQYSHADSTLRHGSSRRCLAVAQNEEKLQMEECSEDNPRQRWRFQNYDPSKDEQVPWSLISSFGNTVAVTNLLLLFAFCFLFGALYYILHILMTSPVFNLVFG